MNTFQRIFGALAMGAGLAALVGCGGGSNTPTTSPAVTFSPAALTFSNVAAGATSAAQTTMLTNSGTAALTISAVTLTGANASSFAITANTCGTSVAVGASCTISVTFTANGTTTALSAAISVADNAAGSPQAVTLTGTGLAAAAVTFSPTTLSFGTVASGSTAAAKSTMLTNSGGSTLTISGVTLTGANTSSFAITANTCGSTVAAGASCSISVTFSPGTVAPLSASISVADNAAGTPQTVGLSGTGAAPGAVSFAPASLTFTGTLVGTTSATQPTVLTNTGGVPINISGVSLLGANPGNFTIASNTCSGQVAAGGTCTIGVTFSPAAVATYGALISVADDVAGSPQTVALAGTGGASGAVTLTPTALAFGSIANGTTAAALSTVLKNTATTQLLINGITLTGTNASSFAISANTCGSTLAAGASCTVSVTFTPATSTSYAAYLSFADSAAASAQTVALTGAGGVPTLTVSASTVSFGPVVVNARGLRDVTVTNTGTVAATLTGVTAGGTNASNFSGSLTQCGSTLAAGKQCTLSALFTPNSVASFSGTLSLADNATGSPQVIAVSGTGELEPYLCPQINDTSPVGTTPTANYAGTAFTGTVKAGGVPMQKASVQLYAAGTTGNGLSPTALGTALTTDANGNFSESASYTCPYSNSVLYAVATGGATDGVSNNSAAVMVDVLGACNSLTGTPSFTINEATTAATAWAMGQFLSAGGKMGASSTNASGITLAAATAGNLVSNIFGSGPGVNFPNTGVDPLAKLNTVANALNACVATTSAASSSCGNLFAAATPSGASAAPTNTLDAVLNLVKQPITGTLGIWNASQASTAYSPALTGAPPDWTLALNYTGGGMNDPSALAIDSKGNLFVANYYSVESIFANNGSSAFPTGVMAPNLYESYGEAVDVTDTAWVANEESSGGVNGGLGSITLVTSGGTSPATYSTGGVYFPIAISFDPSGDAWVADYGNPNAGVVLLTGSGVGLSGATGISSPSFDFPSAVATDSMCNAFVANQSSNTVTLVLGNGTSTGDFTVGREPSGVAVDPNNNVWSANYYDNSVGLISAAHLVLSGAGFTGGGLDHPQGIATDGAGNAWVANYRGPTNANSISEFASASGATPGAVLSPATGWGTDAGLLEAYAIAIDASGNVWVTNFGTNTLTEFVGLAVPVKTPLLGPTRVP